MCAHVKVMMVNLEGCFSTKGDDLLKKYNTIWDKVNADISENLMVNLSKVKKFWKPK